jgi:hypothetical protein
MSRSIPHFICFKLIGSATGIEVSYVLSTYPSILGSELKTRPLHIRLRKLLRSGSATAGFLIFQPVPRPRALLWTRTLAWSGEAGAWGVH